MGITNKYPYTDFHELNLDFILDRLDAYAKQVETLEADAIEAATEAARQYVNERLNDILAEVQALAQRVNEMYSKFDDLTANINVKINAINTRIDELKAELQRDIDAVNIRTDKAIEYNNEYIFRTISDDIQNKVIIINYFTGEKVTLQEMFNYLANLHAEEGLTITEFIAADKTINEIIAINASCSNWIINGKNLIAS